MDSIHHRYVMYKSCMKDWCRASFGERVGGPPGMSAVN